MDHDFDFAFLTHIIFSMVTHSPSIAVLGQQSY